MYVVDGNDLLIASTTAPWVYRNYPGPVEFKTSSITPQLPLNSRLRVGVAPRNSRQSDAIDWLQRRHLQVSTLMLCLNMGAGKTFCALAHAALFNMRVLVLADREVVLDHWQQQALKFLDIDPQRVVKIAGTSRIQEIADAGVDVDAGIVLMTLQSAINALKNDSQMLNRLCSRLGISMVVFDEGHLYFRSIIEVMCRLNVSRALIVTGTPERSDFRSNRVYQNVFKNVPRYEERQQTPLEERHVYVIVARWHSGISRHEDASRYKTIHGFNVARYTAECMLGSGWTRFYFALNSLLSVHYYNKVQAGKKPGSVAVVIKTNEGVRRVYNEIVDEVCRRGLSLSVGIFSTLIPDAVQRRQSLQCDIIVTTEKSFGSAVDLPNLRVLINTIPYSSKITSNQLPMRLRELASRGKSLFIDMVDVDSDNCVRTYSQRRRYYKDFAAEVYDVHIT
jgi:superfamily II DNA or RNA helicase